MNYLQISQETARESGTVSGSSSPSSVVNQSGRLLDVVTWVASAWEDIQNARDSWRFMRKEFPSSALTTANTARYTAASWNITDFAEWIIEDDGITIYDNAVGVSDESIVKNIDWSEWRSRYGRGTQTPDKPIHWAISPANEFCLGPIPDAQYRMNGEYRRSPQVLTVNGDIPICPDRFHRIVKWRALMLLHEHDEGAFSLGAAKDNYDTMMWDMERDQLPKIRIGGGPLA